MKKFGWILCVIIFAACETEKLKSELVHSDSVPQEEQGNLVINEFAPKGNLLNERGENCDWLELYNNSDSVLQILPNEWFITDEKEDEKKFALPEMKIEPHGFVLIYCDNSVDLSENIHANFKISSDREGVYLFKEETLMDHISCDEDLKKKHSYGRSLDGDANWEKMKNPSPGKSNNSANDYAESAH